MKIALAVLMALTPVSAVADEYQRGYSASRTCYKSEYREEYVPGTADNPGYIKSWNETIEVPCRDRRTSSGTTIHRHVKRIRKKFKKVDPDFSAIETRYGSGYRWNVS